MTMKKFQAMKAVYSYYFPEVRRIVDEVHREYQHELFLVKSRRPLDDYHEAVFKKLLWFYKKTAPDLAAFPWQYPTAGSAEGIREYLTWLQTRGVKRIYTLRGDYEGYRETAATRGLKTMEVDLDRTRPDELSPGHWFLSNPSARDGNVIPNHTIKLIADAGHKIFYDLSYLGATPKQRFDLDHDNVAAAALSLSKPYGLFRYRIGFLFCREEVPALYANKWFKNIPSLFIAEKLFRSMRVDDLYKKYRLWQEEIVAGINKDYGLGLKASDSVLLAYLPKDQAVSLDPAQKRLIAPFLRGDNYRFCLTPYFEDKEGLMPKPPPRRPAPPRQRPGRPQQRRPPSRRRF